MPLRMLALLVPVALALALATACESSRGEASDPALERAGVSLEAAPRTSAPDERRCCCELVVRSVGFSWTTRAACRSRSETRVVSPQRCEGEARPGAVCCATGVTATDHATLETDVCGARDSRCVEQSMCDGRPNV